MNSCAAPFTLIYFIYSFFFFILCSFATYSINDSVQSNKKKEENIARAETRFPHSCVEKWRKQYFRNMITVNFLMHISIPIITINLKASEQIATNIHFNIILFRMHLNWMRKDADIGKKIGKNENRNSIQWISAFHSFIYFRTKDTSYSSKKVRDWIYQLFNIFPCGFQHE